MMKQALVVYESLFGDARTIARSIAEGLSEQMGVETIDVGHAPTVIGSNVALLVVGGPTHQMGMTKPASRRQAATNVDKYAPGKNFDAATISESVGLREWFDTLRAAVPSTPAATFDTRLDHPRFLTRLDHASRTQGKLLRKRGFLLLTPPERFLVTSASGPLADGEVERARRWGHVLAEQVAARLAGAAG